jgi:hypothetical protein
LTCRHGGAEKGLGRYQEIRGDEPGPLTIGLERCGTVIGRLLAQTQSQPYERIQLAPGKVKDLGDAKIELDRPGSDA